MNKAGFALAVLGFAFAAGIISLALLGRNGKSLEDPKRRALREFVAKLEQKREAGVPLSEADYTTLEIPRDQRMLNAEVKEVLEHSEQMTVSSLEPYSLDMRPDIPKEHGELNAPAHKTFHGYAVL